MKIIQLTSWAEFDSTIHRFREEHGVFRQTKDNGELYERVLKVLFRGQSNCDWELKTTLERKTSTEFDVLSYIELAKTTKHELESFFGKTWNTPTHLEIKETQYSTLADLPAYDLAVYLRHHGYPSPLLDWTESPFIAAYFAYLDAREKNPAIYCFSERPNLVKGGIVGEPMITVQGPFVTTDKRHFAQKACYTIATKWDYKKNVHIFCSHEQVFNQNNSRQDVLLKIELPLQDRSEVLRKLNDYNINAFTLFQSEDSLVKTLEMKHFDKI